jgi:ABC-type polysaccharide/polyol phosphate export permease
LIKRNQDLVAGKEMEISNSSRSIREEDFSSNLITGVRLGFREFLRPSIGLQLGVLWLILDPFITASLYIFLISVLRDDPNGLSIIIGVLTYRAITNSLTKSMSEHHKEPFPMVHSPSSVILSSLITREVLTAALLGSLGGLSFLFLGQSDPIIILHFTMVCTVFAVMGVGLGLVLFPFVLRLKDLGKIVRYLLFMGFFVQAVLYEFSLTEGFHRELLSWLPHTFGAEWIRHTHSGDTYPFELTQIITVSTIWGLMSLLGFWRFDSNRWRSTTW